MSMLTVGGGWLASDAAQGCRPLGSKQIVNVGLKSVDTVSEKWICQAQSFQFLSDTS